MEHAIVKLIQNNKQKIMRVGDETFVCELKDGKLTDNVKKLISQTRMKHWHLHNHSRENINQMCTLCRNEFRDEYRKVKVFKKKGI